MGGKRTFRLACEAAKQQEGLLLQGRDWHGAAAASDQTLAELRGGAPAELPESYLQLLSLSDAERVLFPSIHSTSALIRRGKSSLDLLAVTPGNPNLTGS